MEFEVRITDVLVITGAIVGVKIDVNVGVSAG